MEHTEAVTIDCGAETLIREVVINITNTDFLNFILKRGNYGLKCDGRRCGCNSNACNQKKSDWKILKFDFNKEAETFTLLLDSNFDYFRSYEFQMNFDAFFKSKLILEFDVKQADCWSQQRG